MESSSSSVQADGLKKQDVPPPSPEDAELTPQGIQKLPALPWAEDVRVSGQLAPARTWATYRMPVGPTTLSLRVTVSHDLTVPAPAIPALDQLYLVGPEGNLLSELKGASANLAGPRQDVSISLSGIPQGDQLLVRIVENPAVVPQTPPPQPAPTANLPLHDGGSAHRAASPLQSLHPRSHRPVRLPSTVGPLLIGYGTSALALVPTSLVLSSSGSVDLNPPVPSRPRSLRTSRPLRQSAEEFDTEAPGVSVGPLVSRGPAPIGPRPGNHARRLHPVHRPERARV